MTKLDKAVVWAAKYDQLVADVDRVGEWITALKAWCAARGIPTK